MHLLPLTTPSLTLRRLVRQDAPLLLKLNSEATTREWLPSQVYANLDEAAASLAWLTSQYDTPGDPRLGPYVLGVEHRKSGELLGHVGFSPLGSEVEVSYAIAESARGQGLGREALATACRWVAEAFELREVVAVTAANNVASRRLLSRAGFGYAGTEIMCFQGSEKIVGRYVWRACALSLEPAGIADGD